jgi:dynein intermediate chain 2, axonemal
LITFYDLRRSGGGTSKETLPFSTSVIEKSHHDPVYDVFWINSKTGNQCVSVSTDGQMLWWDTRRLSEPTDSLQLCTDVKAQGQVLGGSSLEYNSEAGPSKYLVGTEQGVVLMVNLKNRQQNNGLTVFDQGPGKHHGPIYSIQRNPANTKCFLTVGDWTARIWMEDLRTPIMTTKYHSSYLTAGCWSPTRLVGISCSIFSSSSFFFCLFLFCWQCWILFCLFCFFLAALSFFSSSFVELFTARLYMSVVFNFPLLSYCLCVYLIVSV